MTARKAEGLQGRTYPGRVEQVRHPVYQTWARTRWEVGNLREKHVPAIKYTNS